MKRTSESVSFLAHVFHDASTLALLLLLVPFYMLLNQFWKSLVILAAVYGLQAIVFLHIGRYMRRVIRRFPAEIPPWRLAARQKPGAKQIDIYFSIGEAIRNGCKDPHYLQDVLKSRLQQLLAYRMSGSLDTALDALDITRSVHIEPAVFDFLQRREATGLWSRFTRRRHREQDVLTALRYIETL